MRPIITMILLSFTTPIFADTFTPTKGRTVPLTSVIDRRSLPSAELIMNLADGKGEPIDIIINSPGGSIMVGRVIVQAIQVAQSRGHKVRCAVTTFAASMAFTILARCSERYALAESVMLYHPPRIQVQQVITPELGAQLHEELAQEDQKIRDELLAYYPVDYDLFMKHYIRESWHTAAQLNADLNKRLPWIYVVDDIVGMTSLLGDLARGEDRAAPKGQIIYQYTSEK